MLTKDRNLINSRLTRPQPSFMPNTHDLQKNRSQKMVRDKEELRSQLLQGIGLSFAKRDSKQIREESTTMDYKECSEESFHQQQSVLKNFMFCAQQPTPEQQPMFINNFLHPSTPELPLKTTTSKYQIKEVEEEGMEEKSIMDVSNNLTHIQYTQSQRKSSSGNILPESIKKELEEVEVRRIDLQELSLNFRKQQAEIEKITSKPSSIKELILQNVEEEDLQELFPVYQSSEEKQKSLSAVLEEQEESEENIVESQVQNVKQISLSGLDLQDVSDISMRSPSLFSEKKKQEGRKDEIEKFIVKDILSDISELKSKIMENVGEEEEEGSEGKENQENSMVEFIEQFHKLDCHQFKTDVDRLKNKIYTDLHN